MDGWGRGAGGGSDRGEVVREEGVMVEVVVVFMIPSLVLLCSSLECLRPS